MKKAPHIREAGFSLVDLVVVVGIIGVVSAITLPLMLGAIDRMRLGQAARDGRTRTSSAKQRAVGKSSVVRVHFNCPTAREFRSVELIGTTSAPKAEDTATIARCSKTAYPFPAADNNPLTRPNLDGPPRFIDPTVAFGVVQSIEFWPDGSVHLDAGGGDPWPTLTAAGATITLSRKGKTRNITVNGLGKIQLPVTANPASRWSRRMVATDLLATALASLAQLFVISTRANQSSHAHDYRLGARAGRRWSSCAGWRGDSTRIGLPLSDTTTNLAVVPETPTGGHRVDAVSSSSLQRTRPDMCDYPRSPWQVARRPGRSPPTRRFTCDGGRSSRCRRIRTTRSILQVLVTRWRKRGATLTMAPAAGFPTKRA